MGRRIKKYRGRKNTKIEKNIRMKIVAISDTHNKHKNITIPEGDVIVHAGDISSMGYKHEVIHFFEWFSKLPHTHKILIAGNHDFFFQLPESIVKEILPQNITYLYDEEVIIDGIKFWGSPYTPIFGSWAFMESRPELEERWKNIPNDVNVLITHGPPYGILDYEIGDKELKNRLMTIPTNPKAHIFGHIHEGYGIDTKGVTKFINASILNEKYEVVNQPIIIEI